MAQGALKAKAKARATPSNKKTFGSRVIKPKKGKAIKDIMRKKVRLAPVLLDLDARDHVVSEGQKLTRQKSHSSQMTGSVEKALAHRAGHLEMLAGGKKDAKDEGKNAGRTTAKKGAK